MIFEDRANLSDARREALRSAVEGHRTLAEVVRWGLATRAPRIVENVVVQDEYTHDVVLRADDVWLVYDTT